MFLAERMANADNRKFSPVYISLSLYLPGYAVKFCRYTDHAVMSAIYVRTPIEFIHIDYHMGEGVSYLISTGLERLEWDETTRGRSFHSKLFCPC